MVNVLHSVNFPYMLFEFLYVYAVGGFFKEYIPDFLEVFHCLYKQENGNSYGHYRVDIGNIREFHQNCAHEDYCPPEHVFKHVKTYGFLI